MNKCWMNQWNIIMSNIYQTIVDILFAVVFVAVGSILVANPAVAPDDQIFLDGLHQGQRVDFHRTALPLFDAIARRMPLQIALELVRVEEAQGRRARPKVAARRSRRSRRSRQVVNSNGKLFQLVVAAAQFADERRQMRRRLRHARFRRAV